MSKKKRLGRGLEALLSVGPDSSPGDEQDVTEPRIIPIRTEFQEKADHSQESSSTPSQKKAEQPVEAGAPVDVDEDVSATSGMLHLNVYEVDNNPFQPRRDFSETEIASLSESLKSHDMLQPILVRKVDDRYQLISGERRLRAAIQAGWSTIPARLREADDRLVAELAIVENLQRKDLNPLEKALSFRRYLDQHQCPQEELAGRLKIDRSTIANLMRLLELPVVVQDAIRSNVITAGHARALLPLGDESTQVEFCNLIRNDGWSVRQTEENVQVRIQQEDQQLEVSAAKGPEKKKNRNSNIEALEQELRMVLGTKVEIKQAKSGRGRLVVHFSNNDEFLRIQEEICGPHEVQRRAS